MLVFDFIKIPVYIEFFQIIYQLKLKNQILNKEMSNPEDKIQVVNRLAELRRQNNNFRRGAEEEKKEEVLAGSSLVEEEKEEVKEGSITDGELM